MSRTFTGTLMAAVAGLGLGIIAGADGPRALFAGAAPGETLVQGAPATAAGTGRATNPASRYAEILFLGDSIVDHAPLHTLFPGVSLANLGIAGDRTSDILARLDAEQLAAARRVFISAGINDFRRGGAGATVASAASNYERLASSIRELGPEVVILSTPECAVSICGAELAQVRALNRHLRAYAASEDIVFVDVNAVLAAEAEEDGLALHFTTDGTHLNIAGYRHWAKAVAPHLTPEVEAAPAVLRSSVASPLDPSPDLQKP